MTNLLLGLIARTVLVHSLFVFLVYDLEWRLRSLLQISMEFAWGLMFVVNIALLITTVDLTIRFYSPVDLRRTRLSFILFVTVDLILCSAAMAGLYFIHHI